MGFLIVIIILWLFWVWLERFIQTPIGSIVVLGTISVGAFVWGVKTGNWYGVLVSFAIIAHGIKSFREGVEEGRDMRIAYEEEEIDRIIEYECNELDEEFIEEFGMDAFREYVGAEVKGIYTDEGFIRRFGVDAYHRYVKSTIGLQGQRDIKEKNIPVDGVTDNRQEKLRKAIELKNKRVAEYHRKRRSKAQMAANNSKPKKKSKKERFIEEYGDATYRKVINGFTNETYTDQDFIDEFGAEAYRKYNIGKIRR